MSQTTVPPNLFVGQERMHGAEFQYRNNDPSENVEVAFAGSDGIQRVLCFVATRPHWCEQTDIYGDLFSSNLQTVFKGEVDPLVPGSREEEAVILHLRSFVESTIPDYATVRERRQPRMTEVEGRDRCLVWFLAALERRRSRFLERSAESRRCTEEPRAWESAVNGGLFSPESLGELIR
jgi:hypothetical protein